MAKRVLEEHLDGVGQASQVTGTGCLEAVIGIAAIADAQHGTRSGGIDEGRVTGHGTRLLRLPRSCERGISAVGAGRVRPSRVE